MNRVNGQSAPRAAEEKVQLPQHSNDAERSVLGSCLRLNDVIDDVTLILRTEMFFQFHHQLIFQAILDVWNAGKPVDVVVLAEEMKRRKQLEEIGREAYLGSLWDCAPTAANAEHYARIVRDKSIFRSLGQAGQEMVRESFDPSQSAEGALAQAVQSVTQIAESGMQQETVTLQEALTLARDRIDRRIDGGAESTAVPAGFLDLDSMLSGLHDGELILLAARPSCGKTSLALNIAANLAIRENIPVMLVSLEQPKAEIGERILSAEGRVDGHRLRRGELSSEDIDRLIEAGSAMQNAKLFIDDSAQQTMLRIAANARRIKRRHGIRLLIVDYLQLIEPDNRREPREQQVAGISRRLKCLARELSLPLLCLTQLNRAVEDRADRRPRLSDLRESGAQEQDADVVLLMCEPDPDNREGQIDVIVGKNRNGRKGEVTLMFMKQFTRFENFAFSVPEIPFASRK